MGKKCGCLACPAISGSSTITGTYLIDTTNQKNVNLNLDFAKNVTNLPKTQKMVFRDGKKIE